MGGSPESNQNCFSGVVCTDFDGYLNCVTVNKALYPWSTKGEGPGRGNQGGEMWVLAQELNHNLPSGITGTGGGGGSHGSVGTAGDDRFNATSTPGTPGKCGMRGHPNSSLVGVRGAPGSTYPGREAFDVLMGGSGGGAGGSAHGWYNAGGGIASAGGGGGGGGFLEILSAGNISISSAGMIRVSGGAGGKGAFQLQQSNTWSRVAGSGGGGAGGTLSLISGNAIQLAGAMTVNALGGAGGPVPNSPPTVQTCSGCNGGGAGGKGYIFLMSATGAIGGGFNPGAPTPGQPGNYDDFENGVLTIRSFDVNRFGGVSAITELYSTGVADPAFLNMSSSDILALASGDQQIKIWATSSKSDPDEPTAPDVTSEIGAIEMALVTASGGSTNVVIVGDMTDLNPAGGPARDAFVRMRADFLYDDPVEAALGPFMLMDEIIVSFTFN